MEKKVLDMMSRGMSAPVTQHYQHKGDVADEYKKAVKLNRGSKKIDANPRTRDGQRIMNARLHANDAKKYLKGKRTLFPKPKKGMY